MAAQRRHVIVDNGLRTAGALGRKELEEVLPTVGIARLLVVAIIAKVLSTVGAEEVLRMPGLVEGGDASLIGPWVDK